MNLSLVKYIDRYVGILLCYLFSAFHLFREMIWPVRGAVVPRRILLVKLWGLGNIVMLLPVIRAVRRRYPEAEIHFLTLGGNRDLLVREPDLDHVHFLDDSSIVKLCFSGMRELFGLRRTGIDLLIDFEQFARASALFGYLINAKQRIGLRTPGQGRGLIYTVQVPYDDGQHMTDTFLDLARAAGVDDDSYEPLRPRVDQADEDAVTAWLAANCRRAGPLVVMHPGSGDNFIGRRWPTDSYGRLAHALVDRHDANVVITGSHSEARITSEVQSASGDRAHDGCGAFSIREFVALIDRADLLCSNDTAPVHIAAALGRPVVGFYGPNTPRLYGPVGEGHHVFYRSLPCSPCITNFNYKTSFCRMPVCILDISVEEVTQATSAILEEAGSRPREAR
jgi:lipopolysaccharide heptosyltransferase II